MRHLRYEWSQSETCSRAALMAATTRLALLSSVGPWGVYM
jgi:hypothetical protein